MAPQTGASTRDNIWLDYTSRTPDTPAATGRWAPSMHCTRRPPRRRPAQRSACGRPPAARRPPPGRTEEQASGTMPGPGETATLVMVTAGATVNTLVNTDPEDGGHMVH